MKSCKKLLTTAALIVGAASAQASVIFSDDFESNPPGSNLVPAAWTVQNGTVDIVGGGFCLDGSSHCIDLDGSTRDAGDLSHGFFAVSGVTYTLTYQLGGNQRGGSDTVIVRLDGVSQSHALAALDPLQTFTLSFVASSTGPQAFAFSNAGGDNIGAILDNVVLSDSVTTALPEPASFVLLTAGLAGLGFSRRRSWRV
jgi:hypothetical protein